MAAQPYQHATLCTPTLYASIINIQYWIQYYQVTLYGHTALSTCNIVHSNTAWQHSSVNMQLCHTDIVWHKHPVSMLMFFLSWKICKWAPHIITSFQACWCAHKLCIVLVLCTWIHSCLNKTWNNEHTNTMAPQPSPCNTVQTTFYGITTLSTCNSVQKTLYGNTTQSTCNTVQATLYGNTTLYKRHCMATTGNIIHTCVVLQHSPVPSLLTSLPVLKSLRRSSLPKECLLAQVATALPL